MHRGIAEYKAVNLGSASREELVIMLYEAAVRYQIYARTALEKGAAEDARNHLRRVRDIFGELMVALDHTVAPELSSNLARLYSWLIAELGRVGLERSTEMPPKKRRMGPSGELNSVFLPSQLTLIPKE